MSVTRPRFLESRSFLIICFVVVQIQKAATPLMAGTNCVLVFGFVFASAASRRLSPSLLRRNGGGGLRHGGGVSVICGRRHRPVQQRFAALHVHTTARRPVVLVVASSLEATRVAIHNRRWRIPILHGAIHIRLVGVNIISRCSVCRVAIIAHDIVEIAGCLTHAWWGGVVSPLGVV